MRLPKNTVLWSRKTDFYCLYPFLVFFLLCGWAVLVPVFRAAQPSSKSAACQSNLKQSCLASIQYSADWNDILPRSDRWIELTAKNTRSEQVFRCPATDEGEYGYAFMDRLSGKNLTNLKKPEGQLMIVESGNLQRNAHGDVESVLKKPRHRGINLGYADGHVRALH